MRRLLSFLGVVFVANASGMVLAQPMSTPTRAAIAGTWANPKDSVRVATGPCGEFLCGWVVAANAEAVRDAREAGTVQLIGTRLLENYRQIAPASWRGRVFLPDRGSSYYSTIRQLSTDEIRISGCILGGWICKSQVWHRA